MYDHVWWKHLHWPEYGAELLGTAFLVFAGVSAVVFDFGTGSPLAHALPDTSIRRLITGLLFAGSGALVAISPLGKLSVVISTLSYPWRSGCKGRCIILTWEGTWSRTIAVCS
jgi:hypothetical protein